MKRLYLLRHAQALSSSPTGDKGRPLSPQGLADAAALGQMMVRKEYRPAAGAVFFGCQNGADMGAGISGLG
ncbi:MAG: hypothetical protein LRZ85_00395 [Alphaproteobacteria bacterium]|nr:hypothetical protein [Alphaproteobacteria bacterium]